MRAKIFVPVLALVMILPLVSAALPGFARDRDEIDTSVIQPLSKTDSEKLAHIEKYLHDHPHDANSLDARARIYAGAGEFKKAVSDLTEAIEKAPTPPGHRGVPGMYCRRAQYFEDLGKYDLAARDMLKFWTIAPRASYWRSFPVSETAARIFLEAGNYPACIKSATTFITYTPNHGVAFATRAMAYAFSGREREALADLLEAMRLKVSPRDLAKKVICTTEAIDMCLARAGAAARKNPKNKEAFFTLAVIENLGGRFEKACSDADCALKLDPVFYEALVTRGLACVSLGKQEAALTSINRAIQLKPEVAEGYRALEGYYIAFAGVDQLQADLAAREAKSPSNLTLLMARGRAYRLARNEEKERATYDHILGQNAKYAPALFARGELAQRTEDMSKAIQFFNRGLAVQPDNGAGLKARASCYLELRDASKAKLDLEKLVYLYDDPNAYILLEKYCGRSK